MFGIRRRDFIFAGVIDPVGAGLLASLARTIQGVASSFGVELSSSGRARRRRG